MQEDSMRRATRFIPRVMPFSGDLAIIVAFMQAHGSSVILNWGEDNELWECSWITDGVRYTGFSNQDALSAARDCLKHANTPPA
jgi:hypothetical protein